MEASLPTVGPPEWREETLKTIKLAGTLAEQSDIGCHTARMTDPLPINRDLLAQRSNERSLAYSRLTRDVAAQLSLTLTNVTDEIRSATRCKEALEKCLEHRRKDIYLNRQSASMRQQRPLREKEFDGADAFIESEHAQLLELKARLEMQLLAVQQQLQMLHTARQRLQINVHERSKVLQLLCVHGCSMGPRQDCLAQSVPSSRPGSSRPMSRAASAPPNTTFPEDKPLRRSSRLRSAGSHRSSTLSSLEIGPTQPYSNESAAAIAYGKDAIVKSMELRQLAHHTIADVQDVQSEAHCATSAAITQKIAETVTLKQQLQISGAQTRASMNRTRRWLETQEKIHGYTMGPVSSADLTSRERLDRPLVRSYQHHPGTSLPEGRSLVRNSQMLGQSIRQTTRSLGLLNLGKQRLDEDMRDKQIGAQVDSDIVRLRRRRANHRWVMTKPDPTPVY